MAIRSPAGTWPDCRECIIPALSSHAGGRLPNIPADLDDGGRVAGAAGAVPYGRILRPTRLRSLDVRTVVKYILPRHVTIPLA